MRVRLGFCVFVLAALGLGAVGGVSAEPASSAAAPPASAASASALHEDPSVRQGVLANGLRYLIQPTAAEPGSVSLRLGFNAGSFDEEADEHGAAHFNEHLAFGGGSAAGAAGPATLFARAGAAFGDDLNAQTGQFHTVYRLDLTRGGPAYLDQALAWLRGVADQTRISDATVDHERAVILAERLSESDATVRAEEAELAFEAPGLRSSLPTIGTPASLQAMTPAILQRFYRRWYRPDNAVLVVTGDISAAAVETAIRQAFASWTAAGPALKRAAYGQPDAHRPETAATFIDPALNNTLKVCHVLAQPEPGADDVDSRRARIVDQLWTRMINDRLDVLIRSREPPFLSAQMTSDTSNGEERLTCLRVTPLGDGWRAALAAAAGEVARFAAAAPSEDALDDTVADLRAELRGDASAAPTRSPADLAGDLVYAGLEHEKITSATEDFWAFDAAVEPLTPEDLHAAFLREWSGSSALIWIEAPSPVSADDLRTAWDQAAAAPPPPPAPAAGKGPRWAYQAFGRPGHVTLRQAQANPDFVRLTFANGVVLNFKHTDFKKDDVRVRVLFGNGRRELADGDLVAAHLAAALTPAGGLGRNDLSDIQHLFSDIGWSAELHIADDAFVLAGNTNQSSLRAQLQILTAYLSDPGFRPEVDARIPQAVATIYRQLNTTPEIVEEQALLKQIAPGSPALSPPEQDVAGLRMADFRRLLGQALTQDPLEVTIVGDVTEAQATEFVSETFGALKPRAAVDRRQPHTQFLRFPDQDVAPIQAAYPGPDKAEALLIWPLYVAEPARRREEVTLMLLARVFDNALRDRIRLEQAKTYSPEVVISTPDYADQGQIDARIQVAPQDLAAVIAEARSLAQRMAAGDITDEAVETARQPMLSQLDQLQRENSWWAGVLGASSRSHDGVDEVRDLPAFTAQITPAEVRQVAAVWLKRQPIVVTVTPNASSAP